MMPLTQCAKCNSVDDLREAYMRHLIVRAFHFRVDIASSCMAHFTAPWMGRVRALIEQDVTISGSGY